jgi:hypothetical protein
MHWGIGFKEINQERDMESLILVLVILGALIVIASGVWVTITLITGNRHEK